MKAFWFAPDSPRVLALIRIALGLVFLYDAAVRWPFAVELYSADGLPMPVFPVEQFPGTHFEAVPLAASPTMALHSLLLFALAAVACGWKPRWGLWLALGITLWLGLLDQAGTFKKYTAIGVQFMLLLSLTRCGAAWSLDYLLRVVVQASRLRRAAERAASQAKAGETPAPQPQAGETPAPQPQAGETPAPQPQAGETPAPQAQAGETPAPQAHAGERAAPQAKAGETPAPQAHAGETPAPQAQAGERAAPQAKAGERAAPQLQAGETPAPQGWAAPSSPIWPRRLMQVLVAAVYLGSAVTKIRLPDFANGDLLMFALLDDQWGGGYLGLWLSTRPQLLILASMGTVLFEIAFPLLVWNPRLRRPMLSLAVLFHLSLGVTMHLGIFPAVMLAALLAFVEERDLDWLRRWNTRTFGRRSRSSKPEAQAKKPLVTNASFACASGFDLASSEPYAAAQAPSGLLGLMNAAAWGLSAAAICGAGVSLHSRLFDRQASAEFAPLDEETANAILASLTPAELGRYDDYFHRVELGSRLSSDGTHALGQASRFSRGMNVHACARLVQNHPPLRIEWTLVRPDGAEMQFAYPLASSVSHATVGFALNDREQTPPGEYRLILRADGRKVATRGFTLGER